MSTTKQYRYGGQTAKASPAGGVSGVLIRTFDGDVAFRVYHGDDAFTDYELRHDDLSATIDRDALAAFYEVGDRCVLDHGPGVLGLEEASDEG